MGSSQSCINLSSTDNPCYIGKCVIKVKGIESNSASLSEQWILINRFPIYQKVLI